MSKDVISLHKLFHSATMEHNQGKAVTFELLSSERGSCSLEKFMFYKDASPHLSHFGDIPQWVNSLKRVQ